MPAATPATRSTQPPAPDAAGVLARHAQNPSAFLALNAETQHFRVPAVDGLVAYRPAGRRLLVQLGGPFAAEEDQDALLQAFVHHAGDGRRVMAVQLERPDAERYARHGFSVNQVGSSYSVDLATFSLAGGAFVQLRNKVSRARRAGVRVVEAGRDGLDDRGLDAALGEIDRGWLAGKGRATRELRFLVGERGGPAAHLRRLFVATLDDAPVAYVSFSPVSGRRSGWLHDLSRRSPSVPPGVMELIVVEAAQRFRAEQAGWLHFGFTPFTGLAPEHRVVGGSPAVDRVVDLLARHGERIYPAASQVAYKLKWRPTAVQPEYLAVQGRVTPSAVWQLLRLTGAV
ncbi:MAG: bifunctional lysylphosphatidylglycerol flippase/synthetase MprF [Actinomycetes bacterium]